MFASRMLEVFHRETAHHVCCRPQEGRLPELPRTMVRGTSRLLGCIHWCSKRPLQDTTFCASLTALRWVQDMQPLTCPFNRCGKLPGSASGPNGMCFRTPIICLTVPMLIHHLRVAGSRLLSSTVRPCPCASFCAQAHVHVLSVMHA